MAPYPIRFIKKHEIEGKDKMKKILGLLAITLAIGLVCVGCSPKPSPTESAPAPEVSKDQTAQAEKPAAEAPAAETTAPAAEPAAEKVDPNTWDAWYVSRAEWVGSKREFKTSELQGGMANGGLALTVKTSVGDDRVRDFYLAHLAPGLEAGKTYKITVDYQFDAEPSDPASLQNDPYVSQQSNKNKNYIQFAAIDGDGQNQSAIAAVEDYPGRPVAETKYVDAATIGDGKFHTLEALHTVGAGQDSATLMMIVRFRGKNASANTLTFGNFTVTEAAAGAAAPAEQPKQ